MPIPIDSNSGSTLASTQKEEDSSWPLLEHFRVPGLPPAAYYIPEFISQDEADIILRKIQESPQPKWKTVGTGRRLQYWGGNMSKNGVLIPEVLPEWLTRFPNIVERIERFLKVAAGETLGINQVLINEYQPEHGISPHEDGPAFKPLVATVSLGSHTVLDLHQYLSSTSPSPPMTATPSDDPSPRPIAAIPIGRLLLLPRSLLILTSSLYTSHLHGIRGGNRDIVRTADVMNADLLGDSAVMDPLKHGIWEQDRGVRTSLTFRHAQKVLKGRFGQV